jgi:ribonucleoside-diphosphate reductase alpha chain
MLTKNAIAVLERRYLRRDENGRIVETPDELFHRVARAVASAEEKLGARPQQAEEVEGRFYNTISNLEFMPNSPTLANAGRRLGQLAACFVLPVEDSLDGIFETMKNAAMIHQSGGGTGFSFSRLRPAGEVVASTGGVSSGPVSFMDIYNAATEVVKQGSIRRGANMGILRVDHPDILDFIVAKRDRRRLTSFNISVAVTDEYMSALGDDRDYDLVDPHLGRVVKRLKAKEVFNLIVKSAWDSGEPGLVFLDTINRSNPTPKLGAIESTNPCGEQPLLPYESCTLGSINLSLMGREEDGKFGIDYEKLAKTVDLGVRFLDNVVEINRYPLPQIEQISHGNRKIGLGVMGFADLLAKMEVPYDSDEAIGTGGRLMRFIDHRAHQASQELAEERGSFPNFPESIWAKQWPKMRNATVTTVAPTGTISTIAGCSSGIEPFFAIAFARRVMETELTEVNPAFEAVALERGFYGDELMRRIGDSGRLGGFDEVPADVRRIFVTAHEVAPDWHVRMAAEFQKHVDNAVSKTINLPFDATMKDVEEAYLLAYRLGCKGVTVYRDRSRPLQPLAVLPHEVAREEVVLAGARSEPGRISSLQEGERQQKAPAVVASSVACPECNQPGLHKEGGAIVCSNCGYSEVAEIA